jgi:Tfp pilus assembly protein PilF
MSRAIAPRAWKALYLVVPLVAVVSYWNSTSGEFVWDDRQLILEDDAIRNLDDPGVMFANDFFHRFENDLSYGYYRPLVTLSYAIDYAAGGPGPAGFHATNVALHSTCSLLAVLLLLGLGVDRGAALLAGALFAAHPIHTESVAWISGRTDVLAFLFGGASAWIHMRLRAVRGSGGKIAMTGLATVLFAAALLAKEMAVVVPVWIALAHLTVWSDGWKRTAASIAPYVVVTIAYVTLRFAVLDVGLPGQPDAHTATATLLSAPATIARYLIWMAAPIGQTAYAQNPYVVSPLDPRFLLGVIGIAIAVAWTVRRLRRDRADRQAFLVMALIASFAPILNIVRVAAPEDMGAVMAERFCYFPSFPAFALVGIGASSLAGRLEGRVPRMAVMAAGAILVVAAGAMTVRRNEVWRNDRILFEDALRKAPRAELLLGNLATHHIRNRDLETAREVLGRFDDEDRGGYFYQSTRVLLDVARGDYESALAPQLNIAQRSSRKNPIARNNLAFLYRMTGRARAAAQVLEEVIEEGRGYSDVWFNLAEIRREQKRHDEARELYRKALSEKRGERSYGTAMAAMELELDRPREARAVIGALLEHHPEDPGLLNNLGVAARRMGDEEGARRAYAEAVEADPSYTRARMSLARLLLSKGDRGAAEEQLEAIVRLEHGTPLAQEARRLLTSPGSE